MRNLKANTNSRSELCLVFCFEVVMVVFLPHSFRILFEKLCLDEEYDLFLKAYMQKPLCAVSLDRHKY